MANKEKAPNAALIRVHKTSNYTVMSNYHLFDKPPLSLKAKGLMSMFLAFPEDWNYSINGLVAICKESRDAIKSTMEELKSRGYLHVEKINDETGKFNYIYHIYENSKEKLPEGENPHLVQPSTDEPVMDEPHLENPIQLNTNNEISNNQNTNNENSCENVNIFGALELFNLYKQICKSFPQPRELSEERAKKANKRIKKYPTSEYWQTVCEKAENSSFCRSANWFSFDWIIKNDSNSLKVYEGNYDDNKFKTGNKVLSFESGKYAKYHAEQNAAGGAHA